MDRCPCKYSSKQPEYTKWTTAFLNNLLGNLAIVETTFAEIIQCYEDYISKSNKIALDSLWDFLENNSLLGSSESPIQYSRLLFRARKHDHGFEPRQILSYFHIPFNVRYRIANQRFSISGQPMLYLSNSVVGLEKELQTQVADLSIAAFLPKYEIYYNKRIYEIRNTMFDVIVRSLPGILSTSSISYFDEFVSPNYKTIVKDIQKCILSQILTFPVERRCSFVEEYALPQMLTSALLNHQYDGIVYPSTRDYHDITGHHLFSNHELTESRIIELQIKKRGQRARETKMARYATFEPASCRYQLL